MKISRFLDGAFALDGGTIACRVLLDDGSIVDLGLDARIPKTKKERQIFIGAGYPTLAGAKLLARRSAEEHDVIKALQEYLERRPDPPHKTASIATAPEQPDHSEAMAVSLMKAILDR